MQQTIEALYKQALERKDNPQEGSYTNYLYDKGLDKILKKVGEEATEVIVGAKNTNDELRMSLVHAKGNNHYCMNVKTGVKENNNAIT